MKLGKSHKSCMSFVSQNKKEKTKCEHAINIRRCRRCPNVPEEKIKLWNKEGKF